MYYVTDIDCLKLYTIFVFLQYEWVGVPLRSLLHSSAVYICVIVYGFIRRRGVVLIP